MASQAPPRRYLPPASRVFIAQRDISTHAAIRHVIVHRRRVKVLFLWPNECYVIIARAIATRRPRPPLTLLRRRWFLLAEQHVEPNHRPPHIDPKILILRLRQKGVRHVH